MGLKTAAAGAAVGAKIGSAFGWLGSAAGTVIGGLVGTVAKAAWEGIKVVGHSVLSFFGF